VLVLAAGVLVAGIGHAQSPGDDAPRSLCDRLAGQERERCIAEERDRRERLGREEEEAAPRKCDRLAGPERALCLKRGGTVKARAAPQRR
jgi:hypothetical protein